MTETEWLSSIDPGEMLAFIRNKTEDRRIRRFLFACCRAIWGSSENEADRVVLAAVERLVDGANKMSSKIVRVTAGRVVLNCTATDPLVKLAVREGKTLREIATGSPSSGLVSVLEGLGCWDLWQTLPLWATATFARAGLSHARQARFMRDIQPSPFRPVVFRADWRTLNQGACLHIAQAIRDDEDFSQFPILADALYDAGCDEEELLAHCRSEEPHVKECWALDLILSHVG